VTTEEKAAAFDALALALTNCWFDGSWTWFCPTPCGSSVKRATRDEAVADLVEWAGRTAAKRLARGCRVEPQTGTTDHGASGGSAASSCAASTASSQDG
jgi:hypothetical protein